MSPAGVAQSGAGAPGPGEARLLASGALVQQAAQASGLLALLVIVTVLARRLTLSELGAYGLVASLAGYLLVLRNSVAASAVRAMAAATAPGERPRVFAAAARLYVRVGLATGVLIALAALGIAALVLDGDLAADARVGGLGLGAVSAAGIAASVYLDALRAERLLVRAAALEIAGVAVYLALMLALILSGAGLGAVIAASGAMPLLSGLLSLAEVRRRGLPFRRGGADPAHGSEIVPTAGWLLVVELSNLVSYALDRVILGAFRSPARVGLYEGPLRAHNLLYALGGALAVPTVPTASRYVATHDERRLRELVLRGTRYTLALFVPLCVTLMALARPLLDAWLGGRYAEGAAALTILVSYWILYGGLVVTPGFLVGAGRAREVALIMSSAAALNLALSLALTPELGLEGPAVGTAVAFALAFPFLLRQGLQASGAGLGELARRAWVPAYSLGAVLAGALVAVRLVLDPSGLAAVAAIALAGVGGYWLAYWVLWLDSGRARAGARPHPAQRVRALGFERVNVPLFATSLEPHRERIAERLAEVAASGKYILGPEVSAFEQEFADYLGVRHVVGVGNGTDALTIALRALGVKPGDEVICPSLTFYATCEAIVNAGGRPVFCDVDPDTACVTAETVRPHLTSSTRAIVPVHLFGNVAPVAELRELGVPVLEDAAQAAGARLHGVRAGALGDAATFSFFPSKNLPCLGDGGAITTSSDEVAERARTLRFHGSRDKRTHTDVGYNSRLDSIQAAVLRLLLPELDGWNARRREAAATYERAGLGDLLRPLRATDGAEHVYHLYVACSERADELAAALNERGVGARGYYRTPAHRQAPMRPYARAELPATDRLAGEILALPMGPELTGDQVAAVVEACGAAVPA